MPVILALDRLRQEDHKFKASCVTYQVPASKKKKKSHIHFVVMFEGKGVWSDSLQYFA
jgi:hypothetical protein